MRWAFPLKPAEDELLSSFLVRVAHLHGLTPQRFCAYHFRGTEIWTRDIDRSASEALLRAISELGGVPIARVERLTLRGFESVIAMRPRQGVAPWINAVGVHHRLRRRWGLQYCPACLTEQPYFRRSWRLSFVTVCEKHGSMLRDDCPHCHSPLAPHRQCIALDRCHECSQALAVDSGRAIPGFEKRRLIDIQRRVISAVDTGVIQLRGQAVPATDFLQGVHVLTTALASHRPKPTASTGGKSRRESLEVSRAADRTNLLLWQRSILIRWPHQFLEDAVAAGLTQRRFSQWKLPSWLAQGVLMLPEGRARPRLTSRPSLLRQLAKLRKNEDALWRTAHAEILMRAIRR